MLEKFAYKINRLQTHIESVADVEVNEVTKLQFYAIAAIIQSNIRAVDSYLMHIYNYSPGMVYILYMILTYFIAVPLNVIYVFLGAYSKMNIIRLWICVPLFKGLGYTLILIKNINTLIICARLVTMIHVFTHSYKVSPNKYDFIFSTDIWRHCNFTGSSEECLPLEPDKDFKCKKDIQYSLSIFDFLKMHVFKDDSDYIYINLRWLLITSLIWLTTSMVFLLGLRKFIKLFIIPVSVIIFNHIVIFAMIIASVPSSDFNFFGHYKNINNYEPYMFLFTVRFWMIALTNSSTSFEIVGMVWLGTVKPDKIKLNLPIVLVFWLKLIFTFVHVYTHKCCMDHLMLPHIDVYQHCQFQRFGHNIVLFVLIVLLYMKFGPVSIFIYIATQVIYGLMENSLIIYIIIEAIADKFPNLKQKRVLIGFIICVFNLILSIPLTTSRKYGIISVWDYIETCVVSTILFLIITVALIYIYSLDMIVSDHLFTYGDEPSSIAKASWRTIPFIAILVLCAFVYNELFKGQHINVIYYCIGVIVSLIILSPILVIFVVQLTYGVNNDLSPDLPEPEWGPYDFHKKLHRQLFIPQRDLCYRHDSVTCSHKCLLKVETFEEEVMRQQQRFKDELHKFNLD